MDMLKALSQAFIEKVTRKAAPAPAVPLADHIDELADYLALISAERARAVGWGKQLEESLEGVPERNAQRTASLKQEADQLKPPGRLASSRTRQQFEERIAALKQEIGIAEAAEQKALKSLALSREFQSKPGPHVVAAVKKDHPGLAERMLPFSENPELLMLAKQRLVERAQAERKVESIVRDFRMHASKRAIKTQGYGDQGAQWLALPEQLRRWSKNLIRCRINSVLRK